MNSGYMFSSPNSVDYSSPNSVDYPCLTYTNSEEHHPFSFSNTKLPLSRLGVDIGTSNAGQAGGSKAGGSNVGGSNVGGLAGPRARGRPRGVKNKPKENVTNMPSPVNYSILHIPPGSDVVEWVKQFAQSMNVFVNVLAGVGLFSQVAFSQMSSQHPVILSERLSLVSLTGIAGMVTPSGTGSCTFTAAVARLNGIVVGGTVWKLVTMGPVVLTVVTSKNPVVIGAGN